MEVETTSRDVEIISRECIKPSSPTPLHLKTYKLSFLDQRFANDHTPMALYYPFNGDTNLSTSTNVNRIISKRLLLLKQSLSETLTHYYPFAGKIRNDGLFIDCNDDGAYFIAARVEIPLNEFLKQPDNSLINQFIPFDANEEGGSISEVHVAKIQVTIFSCGGLVVCFSFAHKFCDGITMSSFMKSWAANACKNSEESVSSPHYDASSLFPQKDPFPSTATLPAFRAPFLKYGRIVTRRFFFDARAIATLKAKATSSSVRNPSQVEVVSSLIAKCIMKVTKSSSQKPTLVSHAVDLRQRARPTLSINSVGNLVWVANSLCVDEKDQELDSLVCKLRKEIMKADGDFVKSLQGDRGLYNLCEATNEQRKSSSTATNRIMFTSACKFGLYGVDFGWGKPIWISCYVFDGQVANMSDFVTLLNTRSGDGIEAWVSLLEKDMNILVRDEELLAFASFNASPLRFGRRLPASRL